MLVLPLLSGALTALAAEAVAAQLTVALCPAAASVEAPVYRQDFYGANGQPQKIVATAGSLALADCESTVVNLPAANAVAWAALVPPDRLDGPLNYMALQGKFSEASIAVSEIIDTWEPPRSAEASPPSTPRSGAANAPPPVPANNRVPGRSAWLWSPTLWLQSPELIWQLQTEQALTAIYVTVPVNAEGAIENAAALSTFVGAASARSLQVWAVIGDHQDVLAVARPALQARLDAYREYNNSAAAESRLAGVQLDIEPYLLPGFSLAQGNWRERYIDVIGFAREQLGANLRLDLVVPGWWGTHPDWSNQLLDALALPNLSLTVMNYQTNPDSLRNAATPFLAWGQRANVPVRMALETGRLGDEARRYYGGAERGELWLLDIGDQPVLVLFSAPVDGLSGRAFSFTEEAPVPAANSTFAGDLSRLARVLAEVEPEWTRWPAFAGIALHGLEEALLVEKR
ncbi:MAG: hypothetical protein V4603_14920 [Pseudomonadota bacterium]